MSNSETNGKTMFEAHGCANCQGTGGVGGDRGSSSPGCGSRRRRRGRHVGRRRKTLEVRHQGTEISQSLDGRHPAVCIGSVRCCNTPVNVAGVIVSWSVCTSRRDDRFAPDTQGDTHHIEGDRCTIVASSRPREDGGDRVTTGQCVETAEALAAAPLSGSLFAIDRDMRGLLSHSFAGYSSAEDLSHAATR